MSGFFIAIYRFFAQRRGLLFLLAALLFGVFAFLASKISYEEDVTRFVPTNAGTKNISTVFNHLKVKDKVMFLFTPADSATAPYEMGDVAERFASSLDSAVGKTHIEKLTFDVASDQAASFPDFVYRHLPIFTDSADYARLDSLLQPRHLRAQLERDANQLMLPTGLFLKDFILSDPLGLGNRQLGRLRELLPNGAQYRYGCDS